MALATEQAITLPMNGQLKRLTMTIGEAQLELLAARDGLERALQQAGLLADIQPGLDGLDDAVGRLLDQIDKGVERQGHLFRRLGL